MKDSKFIAGWIKQGRLKVWRQYTLRALQLRLQNPLPAELVNTVNGCTNLVKLERWFDFSQTATTLAEFRANAGI